MSKKFCKRQKAINIETVERKKGTKYRAKFTVKYTEFRSSWFESEVEATEWAMRERIKVIDGQANTGSMINVRDFGDLWLEKYAFVRKTYASALRDKQFLNKYIYPKFGSTSLKKLKTVDIDFLFSDIARRGKIKPKTINNCLGAFKKVLSDAVSWGYLSVNPATPIRPLKVQNNEVQIIGHEELSRLLSLSKELFPEEYNVFVFALNTGCRLGEIMGLKWSKVDLEHSVAVIDSTYDERKKVIVPRTKGKRSRRVPLNSDCLTVIRRLALDGRKQESEVVFGRVSYYAVTHQKFKRILEKCGLQTALDRGVTFHKLRHTFASEFMRQGGEIYRLQQLLGHSTIKQTEQYSHFASEHLKGETDRVSFSANDKVLAFRNGSLDR